MKCSNDIGSDIFHVSDSDDEAEIECMRDLAPTVESESFGVMSPNYVHSTRLAPAASPRIEETQLTLGWDSHSRLPRPSPNPQTSKLTSKLDKEEVCRNESPSLSLTNTRSAPLANPISLNVPKKVSNPTTDPSKSSDYLKASLKPVRRNKLTRRSNRDKDLFSGLPCVSSYNHGQTEESLNSEMSTIQDSDTQTLKRKLPKENGNEGSPSDLNIIDATLQECLGIEMTTGGVRKVSVTQTDQETIDKRKGNLERNVPVGVGSRRGVRQDDLHITSELGKPAKLPVNDTARDKSKLPVSIDPQQTADYCKVTIQKIPRFGTRKKFKDVPRASNRTTFTATQDDFQAPDHNKLLKTDRFTLRSLGLRML